MDPIRGLEGDWERLVQDQEPLDQAIGHSQPTLPLGDPLGTAGMIRPSEIEGKPL